MAALAMYGGKKGVLEQRKFRLEQVHPPPKTSLSSEKRK